MLQWVGKAFPGWEQSENFPGGCYNPVRGKIPLPPFATTNHTLYVSQALEVFWRICAFVQHSHPKGPRTNSLSLTGRLDLNFFWTIPTPHSKILATALVAAGLLNLSMYFSFRKFRSFIVGLSTLIHAPFQSADFWT